MSALVPHWLCQECGKKFTTLAAVKRAMSVGCPKCNGGDIQQATPVARERAA